MARVGRRTWSLDLIMTGNDLFGPNQSLYQPEWGNQTGLDEEDYQNFVSEGHTDNDLTHGKTILTDINLYSSLIHRSGGGQIPVLFQPDVNDPTNIAIVKLDAFTYTASASGHNVWKIKLKLTEVW